PAPSTWRPVPCLRSIRAGRAADALVHHAGRALGTGGRRLHIPGIPGYNRVRGAGDGRARRSPRNRPRPGNGTTRFGGGLMKLGTVSVDGAQRVAVALDDDRAVVLYPGLTVPELIEDWAGARDAVDRAVTHGARKAVPLDELTWLPPVPRPGKVICVALNNS